MKQTNKYSLSIAFSMVLISVGIAGLIKLTGSQIYFSTIFVLLYGLLFVFHAFIVIIKSFGN